MSSKTILNICLKVVGIFYALHALNMIPSTVSTIIVTWDAWKRTAENDPVGLMLDYKLASFLSILVIILLYLFALFIILKSEKIVNLLLKNNEASNITLSDNFAFTALDISIKIFGFFSVIYSVPSLSKILSRYLVMKESIKLYDNTGKIELASAGISAVLYIGIGLLLIFYSRPLSQKMLGIESIPTLEKDDET